MYVGWLRLSLSLPHPRKARLDGQWSLEPEIRLRLGVDVCWVLSRQGLRSVKAADDSIDCDAIWRNFNAQRLSFQRGSKFHIATGSSLRSIGGAVVELDWFTEKFVKSRNVEAVIVFEYLSAGIRH